MVVNKIELENFRNYKNLDLNLRQGFVVLIGPNGSGKTNFLESLLVGVELKRFPGSTLGNLFLSGENHFRINLALGHEPETQSRQVYYEQTLDGHRSQLKIDGRVVVKGRYLQTLRAVSFLPEDLNILTRSPGGRRSFLDETLSRFSLDYRGALTNYKKSLRQRNELLRSSTRQDEPSQLLLWDEQLAMYGSEIIRLRCQFVEYINQYLPRILREISPELSSTKLSYQTNGSQSKEEFVQILLANKGKEKEPQTTIYGPHRDDFTAIWEGEDIVGRVSRGQLRAITLALKVVEKLFLEQGGQKTILLLDDVFSEFDDAHQKRLIRFAESFTQVFMTTTHIREIEKYLSEKDSEIYEVSQGYINKR